MRLTLAEPKYLKESISIISDLVNEACFKIKPDAVELTAMDPANVAMVIFKLFSSTFTEYDVKSNVELAINLSNLKQILRRANPNDMVTLEHDSADKLKIILKGTTKRTFSIPIIELDEKEQRVPDLSFPASVTMNSSLLSEAMEDADIVAESVTFVCEPEKFTVNAEGDLSKASIEIRSDDETKIVCHGTEKIKAKYSIEYLKKMAQANRLAPQVTLSFNKDYPLKLEYKALDRLLLAFILAPRVDNT